MEKKVKFEFDALEMSAKIKLDLDQDGVPSLEIKVNKELLEEIYAEIKKIKEA